MEKSRKAFVMPAIMIVGTVLFIVLVYAINMTLSARGIITTSRNQILARQAAESGIAYARSCIVQNNRVVTWTDEKPLRPNTDCRGDVIIKPDGSAMSPYLLSTNTYRSSFTVKPSDVDDTYKTVAAQGFLDFLNKSNGSVYHTYDYKLSAYIKTDVTFSDIVFGSLYVGSGYNDLYSRSGQSAGFSKAVYFFTKTHLGNISSVGYNMDGVLTGYNDHDPIPWNQHLIADPKEWYHTPYSLSLPINNNVPISQIFTDFQGNGWVAFFLGSDGRTIYGTGSNINCDLGLGGCNGAGSGWQSRPIWLAGEAKMDPSNIPADEKVIDIVYNSATFLLTDAGKLYATGLSTMGPGMGRGYTSDTTTRIARPVLVEGTISSGFNNKKIRSIYSDSYYEQRDGSLAVAVTEDGYLYAWGRGVLNIGRSPTLRLSPGQIISTSTVGKIVDAITDGGTIWALDENGKVWSSGSNKYGQLGINSYNNKQSSFSLMQFPDPDEKVVKMTADGFSALFLTEAGNIYGVGLNDQAQLGFTKNTESCTFSTGGWFPQTKYVPCSKVPRRYNLPNDVLAQDIFIVSPAIKYVLGTSTNYALEADHYRNSFVITTNGEVYGAGSNYHGQLGVGAPGDNADGHGGSPQEYNTPQKMILDYGNNDSGTPGDENKPVVAKYVRSGLGTTIVITDRNHVFTVGNNSTGQLGSGSTVEYHIPKRHRYTNVFQTWYY